MSHNEQGADKSVKLTIDGIPVTVPAGTTILEAAGKVNVRIPALCDFSGLGPRAVCRVCVVECDGRSKLVPACANEVWEGAQVVTNNGRIQSIRKTIIELLLANHPQECLSCVRSGNCELQRLAADFGIREAPFRRSARDRSRPEAESETLVRDMRKCVKCGRCVEVCQEIQSVRAINTSGRSVDYSIGTPYRQALCWGPCIFCGQCAAVCPVGAIYGYDHSAEAWAAINDCERHTVVQAARPAAAALDSEFGLPPGTVTAGKMVTALRLLGFGTVLDAGVFAEKAAREEDRELCGRINSRGGAGNPGLPMISGCSPALENFIGHFYPDLACHLPSCKNPEQMFAAYAKSVSAAGKAKLTSVSVIPCIAWKYGARRQNADICLTVRELASMLRLACVDFVNLPESPFDSVEENPEPPAAHRDSAGVLSVNGFANARRIMDSIRRGECNAVFVDICGCLNDCRRT